MTTRASDLITELLIAEQPTSADNYRQEAARLRHVAEAPENVPIREQLLQIARQFDELAESFGRSRPH